MIFPVQEIEKRKGNIGMPTNFIKIERVFFVGEIRLIAFLIASSYMTPNFKKKRRLKK